jgi:hypothetical protein
LGDQRQADKNGNFIPGATAMEPVQRQCYFHYVFSVLDRSVTHGITF